MLAEQQGSDGSSSRKGASTLPNGVQEQELMAWCHTEIQVLLLPQHGTAGGRGADNRRTDQGVRVDGVMCVVLAGGPSDASRGDAVWPSAGHEVRRPAKPDRGQDRMPSSIYVGGAGLMDGRWGRWSVCRHAGWCPSRSCSTSATPTTASSRCTSTRSRSSTSSPLTRPARLPWVRRHTRLPPILSHTYRHRSHVLPPLFLNSCGPSV